MKNLRQIFSSFFNKSLDIIEYIGNKLPHPATLFALLALIVAFFSLIGDFLTWSAIHPANNSTITVQNLLSSDGIRWIYTNVTFNFVNFPPLGYVLAVMIGIGVAEGSGLFTALIRALMLSAPKKLITFSLVFTGILSHIASEAGYVILIPLGAMLFHALGRHPIAGLAAAFCGVSGGFGANFLIGSVDPILAGLSQSAAQILDPIIKINAAVNFYFMFVSAVLITFLGTFITEKIVEPRLKVYSGNVERTNVNTITPDEKKGLKWAGISALLIIAFLTISIVPENGILRNPETKEILHSPFFDGIIT